MGVIDLIAAGPTGFSLAVKMKKYELFGDLKLPFRVPRFEL